MGQDFANMAESVSQSSNLSSESIAYMSQDFHQASRYAVQASRYFMVTCVSLSTSALAASMTYLQSASCNDDPDSMLCVAPLKSMAATTIATGLIVIGMLMSKRIQPPVNDNLLISEEGIIQNFEWTEGQLAIIKAKNFDVFSLINIKRKCKFCKWTKSELEWLLSQDRNVFLNVILGEVIQPQLLR